jgi:hypothetical protein
MELNMSTRIKHTIIATAGLFAAFGLTGCEKETPKTLTYQADIKSILDQHCVECHKEGAEGTQKSGLLLDTYAATMRGTRFGPVVIPGQSINSTLYRLISGQADPSLRMPHDKAPLPEETTNKIKDWIDQGAKEQ